MLKGWKRYQAPHTGAKWMHDVSLAELEVLHERGVWNAVLKRSKAPAHIIASDMDKNRVLTLATGWLKKNPKG